MDNPYEGAPELIECSVCLNRFWANSIPQETMCGDCKRRAGDER